MIRPDHRHYLGWDTPALPSAAEVLARTYGQDNLLDLARALIALPGGRAGRRFKEILVEYAHTHGLRLVPPRIVTVGALPEALYQTAVPLAEDAASHRAWAAALRMLDPADRRVLFPHAPADGDLRGWISLGRQLHALQHDVGGGALRFADVITLCDDGLLFDDSDRWTRLARVQQSYLDILGRMGRADRDHARMAALDTRSIACDGDLWLIGLAELPLITRRMVAQLAGGGSPVHCLVHAPAELADAFDTLGCVLPAAWIDRPIQLRDDQITIVEHPSNQASAAVAAINRFGGAFAPDEIVLGVPDEEVIPYLEQRIADAGAQARYAGGTPLSRTAVFRMLEAVADLIADGSFESLAALARHPAVGDWLRASSRDIEHTAAARFRDHDAWLADLDAFSCERLPARVTDGLTGEGGRGRRVVEALVAGIMSDRLLGSLRGVRALDEWMPLILELVIELYGRAPLNRDIPGDRRLIDAARRLRDAAAAQQRVPASPAEVCDAGTAIRILLDDAAGDAVPADAGDAAIELLGWLELHLDDAPAVVITGMNEPFVPQAVNAHPFLPNTLRTRAGLEDNERRYARDAYQLTAMLHARRYIHITGGHRSVLGDPIRPSRLLLATSGPDLARRVQRFLHAGGGQSDGDMAAPDAPSVPTATRVSAFHLPPDPEIELTRIPDVLNVTDFARLLADPYAFALGQLLGREGDDDSARELDALRFGSLAHRVLELFAQSDAAASKNETEISLALDNLLDRHIAETYGEATSTSVRLQVEQLRIRLRAFARWQAQWIDAGWTTIGVECRVDDAGVPFETPAGTIRIRGRIDRIDFNARTAEWAVFDYKTGEKAESPDEKHRRKGEWVDLQLPLYRMLLPHVTTFTGASVDVPPDATIRLGYIQLCGSPDRIGCAIADWTDTDLAEAASALHQAVAILHHNLYAFEDRVEPFASQDMKALLGHGRLILEDDDLTDVPVEEPA